MALSDNLVSYWPFNGNANDIENGNNGTVYGATLDTGIDSECYSYDGVDDWIEATEVSLDSTLGVSVSFWFNILGDGSTNDINVFFRWHNDSNNNFDVRYDQVDDELQVNAPNSNHVITSYTPDSSWHHIVLTIDSGNYVVYLDGNQIASFTAENFSGTASFEIGGWGTIDTRYINSKIDEVGLWERALSSSEVSDLYNNGAGLFYPFSALYTTYTDSNGNYSFSDLDDTKNHHICVQYDDGSNKHNAKSYPYVSSSGGVISGTVTDGGTAVENATVFCIEE